MIEASKKAEHEKPSHEESVAKRVKGDGEKQKISSELVAKSDASKPKKTKTSVLDAVTHVKGLHNIILGYLTALEDVDQTAAKTLTGHTADITSVAVSPNSKYVISGSNDETIKIWEIATGKCLHTLTGHTDWITSVAVSPDAHSVISGSLDKIIKIWPTQAAMIEEFDAEQNSVQVEKIDENDSASKK